MRKNKLSSPGSVAGGGTVPGGEWELENHCLLCLQPQTLQTLLEVDERTPELRKDFRPLIYYLTGSDPNQERVAKTKNEDGQDCDDDNGGAAGIWMTMVTNLPPMMCPSCHDILGELYRLHRELLRTQWLIQKQTELAREIVTKAGDGSSSSGQLFHSKIQSSEIPAGEADAMMKFVEELHNKIVVADSRKQKVIFPSSPPPYFVPEAGSKSTSSSSWLPLHLPNGSIRLSRCDRRDDDADGIVLRPSLSLPNSETDAARIECHNDDQDGDMFMASYSEHEDGDVDSPSDNGAHDSDVSSSNYSAPNVTAGRKRRKGPLEPDDEDEYPLPPKRIISKAKGRKTAQEVAMRIYGPRPSTAQSLVKTEAGTAQYCDLCGDLVPSPDMKTHLEDSHHVHGFISKCPNPTCPCVFSCEGKLQKHLRFHPSKYRCLKAARLPTKLKPRKCATCRFKTVSNPEFREHLAQHETDLMETVKGFQQCPLPGCRHGFALRQSLEEHIFSHNSGETGNRKKHLLKSTVAPSQECDLCGMSILSSKMVSHLEGHSPELNDYITKCPSPECLLVFSCLGKMEKHLRGEWVNRMGRNVWWKGSRPCRKAAKIPPGAAPVKCDACSEMVANRRFLKNHLQQHELLDCDKQEKNLTCPMPDCDKRYALRQSVEDHLISHDLRPRISSQDGLEQECSVCNETIPIGGISEHLKESHELVEIIPCRNCPFMFHSWESLLDHLFEHRLNSTSFGMLCDMCGDDKLKFHRYDSLRQHYFSVHKIGAKLICEECDAEFFTKEKMALHKGRSHSANPSKTTKRAAPSKCDQCPDTFPAKDMLLNHKIKVHGAPPMKCKFCDQGFLSVHTWRKHQRAHMGLKKTFACTFEGCGKVFKVKTGWRRHEREGHLPPGADPPAKLFICDICGVGYNLKPSLKGHIEKIHLKKEGPGKGSHICEICGLSLASSAGLAKHKIVHNEEKPHSCPVCSQPFRRKINMLRHLEKHEERGEDFKPRGAFKHERRRRMNK